MKQFMKTCYTCGSKVKKAKVSKDSVSLNCMRCPKCGEEYFTSTELIKYDILTGKRKLIRKFGILGDSTIMRFPTEIIKGYNIQPGDYGVFEKRNEGILIKPVRASEIK